jgi:UDP-glucose 4-epimerase
MEYLVTGGAGFIGSNIVKRLVREKKQVRVLDNLLTGRMENLKDIISQIEFIQGDITDENTVRHAIQGVKYVLHLAALPSVPRSVEDPVTSDRINCYGTLLLLVAARDAKVKRFVFSSSSSVYGDTPTLPKKEDMPPAPVSPYGVQKLSAETYCRIFYKLYGLETFSLRYFNVFGPGQNPHSQYAAVIPLFIKAIAQNKPPTIFGDGEQTRDFTYVDDVVDANLLCCTAPTKSAGKVFNIARGGRVSINELANTIMKIMGKNPGVIHTDPRPGDILHSQADISLAERELGWKPKADFEDGLRKTIEYFLSSEYK